MKVFSRSRPAECQKYRTKIRLSSPQINNFVFTDIIAGFKTQLVD